MASIRLALGEAAHHHQPVQVVGEPAVQVGGTAQLLLGEQPRLHPAGQFHLLRGAEQRDAADLAEVLPEQVGGGPRGLRPEARRDRHLDLGRLLGRERLLGPVRLDGLRAFRIPGVLGGFRGLQRLHRFRGFHRLHRLHRFVERGGLRLGVVRGALLRGHRRQDRRVGVGEDARRSGGVGEGLGLHACDLQGDRCWAVRQRLRLWATAGADAGRLGRAVGAGRACSGTGAGLSVA
ncbi:hypothetical protein M2169_004083 [Streptomyces sp. MJP52]|nr:hypothetical protein [Streptomyces sp. MJP52]